MATAASSGVNRWLTRAVHPAGGRQRSTRGPCRGKIRPHHDCDHNPNARFQEFLLTQSTPQITLYTSAVCGYCVAAKNFLKSRGLSWNEVRIDVDPAEREKMVALARRTSVPQLFIGDTHVGGYDDMMALHRAGKLEPLLAGDAP
jgi:glutaredoxin 3